MLCPMDPVPFLFTGLRKSNKSHIALSYSLRFNHAKKAKEIRWRRGLEVMFLFREREREREREGERKRERERERPSVTFSV